MFDRGDVDENFVMVCGSGTTGCHGLLTVHDEDARRALGVHLLEVRPDVVGYVLARSSTVDAGVDWLERRLFLHLP